MVSWVAESMGYVPSLPNVAKLFENWNLIKTVVSTRNTSNQSFSQMGI